jgi:hypothetical protein
MAIKYEKMIQCMFYALIMFFSCSDKESPNTYQKLNDKTHKKEVLEENVKINYHVFIYPGLKLDRGKREVQEELDLLQDKLNVSLSTTIFEPPLDRELFPQTPGMFMDSLEIRIDEGTVDLFYAEKSDKRIDELINNGKLINVDTLIKEYAPYIYNTYPEEYWTYRKNTGDVYGIPLKNYDELNSMGFWIIDKMYTDGVGEIRNIQELIDILRKTEQPDISFNNYYMNFLSSTVSDDINAENTRNICLTYTFLADDIIKFAGYPVFGKNEFYLEKGSVEIMFKNQELKAILNRIIPVIKKAVYTPLFNDPIFGHTLYKNLFFHTGWSCAKISFDENVKPGYSTQYDKLKNIFSGEKYIYVSDFKLMEPSPFISNRYLYIPQSSQNAIDAIKMIDELYSNRCWYDLFVYGVDSFSDMPDHEYDYEVTGLRFYDNSYRIALAKLVNPAHHRMPAYYPESVKRSYADFIEQQQKMESQYSIPIVQLYRQTLEDLGLNHYIDKITVRRALLSDPANTFYPKETPKTIIEAIQQELQKRIDRYMRNITSKGNGNNE